jgi:hypothetical protein
MKSWSYQSALSSGWSSDGFLQSAPAEHTEDLRFLFCDKVDTVLLDSAEAALLATLFLRELDDLGTTSCSFSFGLCSVDPGFLPLDDFVVFLTFLNGTAAVINSESERLRYVASAAFFRLYRTGDLEPELGEDGTMSW